MLDRETLRDLLSSPTFGQRDKVLFCLYSSEAAMPVAEIRALAVALGYRGARDMNISTILSRAGRFAARTADGWELTGPGRAHVDEIAGALLPSVTPLVVSTLRKNLHDLPEGDTRSFAAEAIACFEAKLYRSSIVFTWIGAVSLLQDVVLRKHLSVFNSEALRRDAKWKEAKNSDDLSRMKEYDFLQVIHAISMIGKNTKDELEVCLKLRNGCGHPNSLKVGEHKASAHIETLLLFVAEI